MGLAVNGQLVILLLIFKVKKSQFIGPEVEMTRLKGLLDKRSSRLIVVRGRRRIGKSRLLAEFGKESFSTLITQLPGWEGIMGLQFENLVVHNRKTLWKILGIFPEEIVMEGPFFQNPTVKQPGCQIDYMIQTRFHNLYICEIKFSKDSVGNKIIEEMEKKRKNLKIPKNCSIRPVLIHVNGVDERVIDERYFDKIVDFGELLCSQKQIF